MPRRKKQQFSFPEKDQITDAQIDAEVLGNEVTQSAADKIKQDSTKKKELSQIVKEIPQIFQPEQVAFVFKIYSGILSFICGVVLKYDVQTIYKVIEIDDATAIVYAKPLARVLSKYAPSEWAGMTAEIELIACMGLYTVTSFGHAKNAIAKDKLEKEKLQRQQQRQRNVVTQPAQETVLVP